MIHRTLEQRLVRTALVWKWQAVIKSTAMVLSLALLVALVIGGLAQLGWISTQSFAYLIFATTLIIGVVAWIAMMIRAVERKLDRRWLAAAVEQDQEQLMDRFNAVVELETRPNDISAAMYREAIERQAFILLRKHPDRSPFSWLSTSLHLVTSVLLLLLTVWFYTQFQPLQLLANDATPPESSETGDMPLSIPEIPSEDSGESLAVDEPTDPWGEVRISQPGRNLRVTRHEDIPLLIEAAADRPLADVFWSTSINVDEETKHDLPEFEDPRYAVFQPILKPDDLGLGDWDVLQYRAVAITADETEYQSATYFVEIIPSRDQLDQIPESAYRQLEQMSELIQRQQEAIRQTDQLGDPLKTRQMDALAEQENRIAGSAGTFQSVVQSWLPPKVTEPFETSIQSARTATSRC